MSEEAEELKKELQQLRTWLGSLDGRLGQVESQRRQESSQPILDEIRVAERRPGILNGRTVSTSPTRSLVREFRVGVCSTCGGALGEEFSICSKCGGKLDTKCMKTYKGQKICFSCLQKEVPIQPHDYLVLACVANNITDVATLSKLTKIPGDRVKASIGDLLSAGLIEKKGWIVFSELQITDEGMNAFSAYRSVFGTDYESWALDQELRKYLRERLRASRSFAR